MPVVTIFILMLIVFFLIALIQIHIFEIAFAKLGLTPEISLLVLIGTIIGSGINLPIFSMRGHLVMSSDKKLVWEIFQPAREGKVVVAVNVGGCVIPVCLCAYFISLQLINPLNIIIGLFILTAISYKLSRLMPGVGVGMPIFIAPLASALVGLVLDPQHAAHLAYISGVLGVLIGADILHLKQVATLGTPVAAIGGAGTFDGIFITGIIAALLA